MIPINGYDRQEHDSSVNAKNISLVKSTATIFAVVNTGAVGVGQSIVTIANTPLPTSFSGNITLDPGSFTGIKGNVTIDSGNVSLKGNVTLSGPLPTGVNYIGLATIDIGSSPTLNVTLKGNVTIDSGVITTITNPVAIKGNLTIDSGNISLKGNVTLSGSLPVGANYIGLATIDIGSAPTLNVSPKGNVTIDSGVITTITNPVALKGNLTIDSGNISIKGNVTLTDPKTYIGLATATLGAGTQFMGLVTAWTRNAGTVKTLVTLPVGLGNNSLATVAVPTNNQKINVTQMILGSNLTTEIAIKSGVTYLTGNASLGMPIFPGGGFVMSGAPDSPTWISLPSGGLVLEKRDVGGTVSKISGHVVYFDE
jgi:hypothetical protein